MIKPGALFTKKVVSIFFLSAIIISGAIYIAIAHAQSPGNHTAAANQLLPRSSVHHTPTARPVSKVPTQASASPASTTASISQTATPSPASQPLATPSTNQTSTSSTSATSSSTTATCSGCWLPTLSTSFQWQLQGTIDQSYAADLYDIDGFDNSSTIVSELHTKGHKVACYIDAGSWEKGRSDASQFPASVLGKVLDGWPDEKWLDIRQIDTLAPIMQARINMCKSRGFDVIEFDNVDGYSNKTGFSITANDQLTYNIWLASQAHQQNMAVLLKNDPDQVAALVSYFDGELDEQCAEYQECAKFAPFIQAGKPVFEVEYNLSTDQFCPQANSMKFFAQAKDLDLGPSRTLCHTA